MHVRGEFHCGSHMHLKDCYFGSLERWSDASDPKNAEMLAAHARALTHFEQLLCGDPAQRNRRRTLRRQRHRVLELLATVERSSTAAAID